MGTSKPGRYMNTKGSAQTMSQFALIHASEGRFTKPQKSAIKLRLAAGGHSQKGLELLEKYGIKYNIVKTYPNGVRVGNIPNHQAKRKRLGISQTWFPSSWNEKKIKRAAEHVARLYRNRNAPDGLTIFGTYKGVRVGVMKTNGQIATAFPDKFQP
ncbi:EndoU domain-containing protein [Hallerella porci]|uniref:EndoU nuclease-like protein n=1 Tax=Hallerella porci TaxID=1945871 RepID=A0ABX5LNK0_9BACT|nr:EndoU domain-containing protein [Hallerella porci]PWL03706.1 EndoU nuclease-like protein [Hallerella porci]